MPPQGRLERWPTFFSAAANLLGVKLETFIVASSVVSMLIVAMYVFYSFFSGEMGSFAALTLVVVVAVSFGFFIAVAGHLAEQRTAGGIQERQRSLWSGVRTSPQRSGVITGIRWDRTGQRRYTYALSSLAVVGVLIIPWAPVIGIMVTLLSSMSLVVLKAAQTFGEEELGRQ